MKEIKVMKTEFVEAYINVLVEAYGDNVFTAIKEVVEDGSSRSPKNMEELKEYARKDILWNFRYSKDKEITEKFCREVAEPYINMFGSTKYLLDKSKGMTEISLLLKGWNHFNKEEINEVRFDGYVFEKALELCKERGYEVIKVLEGGLAL
jgi:hypothetical protein